MLKNDKIIVIGAQIMVQAYTVRPIHHFLVQGRRHRVFVFFTWKRFEYVLRRKINLLVCVGVERC